MAAQPGVVPMDNEKGPPGTRPGSSRARAPLPGCVGRQPGPTCWKEAKSFAGRSFYVPTTAMRIAHRGGRMCSPTRGSWEQSGARIGLLPATRWRGHWTG